MGLAVETILEHAGKVGASDLIITAGSPVIMNVSGNMKKIKGELLDEKEARSIIFGMLDQSQIARFELERELDFSISFDSKYRFRGSAFWQRGAPGAVLRLVPQTVPPLNQLGLPAVVEEMAEARQGLLLVTGPTGHGKSTTLAAMVESINQTRACHIVTVEDPIEFVHSNEKAIIEQREVGSDTLSFASALRHVLRQSPDVIMVGEMRDLEAIGAALTAAETGHLVLATLHTNDAPQTIDRIIDVFPPHQQNQIRTQLSMSLIGIVAQVLLPGMQENTRELACEILRVTPAVANLIREGKISQLPGIIETQGKLGMCSMDASIKQLFMDIKINEDTAKKAMKHPQVLFG